MYRILVACTVKNIRAMLTAVGAKAEDKKNINLGNFQGKICRVEENTLCKLNQTGKEKASRERDNCDCGSGGTFN